MPDSGDFHDFCAPWFCKLRTEMVSVVSPSFLSRSVSLCALCSHLYILLFLLLYLLIKPNGNFIRIDDAVVIVKTILKL